MKEQQKGELSAGVSAGAATGFAVSKGLIASGAVTKVAGVLGASSIAKAGFLGALAVASSPLAPFVAIGAGVYAIRKLCK